MLNDFSFFLIKVVMTGVPGSLKYDWMELANQNSPTCFTLAIYVVGLYAVS